MPTLRVTLESVIIWYIQVFNLLVLVNFQIFVVKSQGYEKNGIINVSFLLTLTRGLFETSVLRRFTACKEHCH
jgi:hypothetical protein